MRVLIVDDSRFVRQYLRQHLEQMGVVCEEAENGYEAVERLRSLPGFDLMLSDVNMPEMNGLESLRRLRVEKLAPAMKVVMITTEADHSCISLALDLGADEFLMKPFTPQSLHEKLALIGLDLAA
jgi:two-component system, chemotaxis family, chemotaxis protein CheY